MLPECMSEMKASHALDYVHIHDCTSACACSVCAVCLSHMIPLGLENDRRQNSSFGHVELCVCLSVSVTA